MLVSKEGFGDMKITFSWCAAAEALAWRLIYAMKKCWHYKLKGQRTVHVHNDSRMMTVLQYLWFTKKCIILDRRETWETCPCSFLVSILGPLQFFFFFYCSKLCYANTVLIGPKDHMQRLIERGLHYDTYQCLTLLNHCWLWQCVSVFTLK